MTLEACLCDAVSRYRGACFRAIPGTLGGRCAGGVLRLLSAGREGQSSLDKAVPEQSRAQTPGQATFSFLK